MLFPKFCFSCFSLCLFLILHQDILTIHFPYTEPVCHHCHYNKKHYIIISFSIASKLIVIIKCCVQWWRHEDGAYRIAGGPDRHEGSDGDWQPHLTTRTSSRLQSDPRRETVPVVRRERWLRFRQKVRYRYVVTANLCSFSATWRVFSNTGLFTTKTTTQELKTIVF